MIKNTLKGLADYKDKHSNNRDLNCLEMIEATMLKFMKLSKDNELTEQQQDYCQGLYGLLRVLTTPKFDTLWKSIKLPAEVEQELINWVVPNGIANLGENSRRTLSVATGDYSTQQNLSSLVTSDKLKLAMYIVFRYDELLRLGRIPESKMRMTLNVTVSDLEKVTARVLKKCAKVYREDENLGQLLAITSYLPTMALRGTQDLGSFQDLDKFGIKDTVSSANLQKRFQSIWSTARYDTLTQDSLNKLFQQLGNHMDTSVWFNSSNSWAAHLELMCDLATEILYELTEADELTGGATGEARGAGGFMGAVQSILPRGVAKWLNGDNIDVAGEVSTGASRGANGGANRGTGVSRGTIGQNQVDTRLNNSTQQNNRNVRSTSQYSQNPRGTSGTSDSNQFRGQNSNQNANWDTGYSGNVYGSGVPTNRNQSQQRASQGNAEDARLQSILQKLVKQAKFGSKLTISLEEYRETFPFEVLGTYPNDEEPEELLVDSIRFEDLVYQIKKMVGNQKTRMQQEAAGWGNQDQQTANEEKVHIYSDCLSQPVITTVDSLIKINNLNKLSQQYYHILAESQKMKSKVKSANVREEQAQVKREREEELIGQLKRGQEEEQKHSTGLTDSEGLTDSTGEMKPTNRFGESAKVKMTSPEVLQQAMHAQNLELKRVASQPVDKHNLEISKRNLVDSLNDPDADFYQEVARNGSSKPSAKTTREERFKVKLSNSDIHHNQQASAEDASKNAKNVVQFPKKDTK